MLLVLARDLMFSGRIGATARAEGVDVKILRDPNALAEQTGATRLIVDLDQPEALDAAAAWKARTRGDVTGFVAHTNTDAVRRAKEAGLDSVLTRGAFVEALPRLLRGEG